MAAAPFWHGRSSRKTAEPEGDTHRTSFEQGTAAMSLSFIRVGTYNDRLGTQFEWDVTLAPLGEK